MIDNHTKGTKKIRAKDNPMLAETLLKNEKKVNKLCCTICVAFAVICLISAILNFVGLFKMSTMATIVSNIDIVILIVPVILNKTRRIPSNVMKYIILSCCFVTTLLLDAAYSYNAALVIAMPVMMAALYFDIRTVALTSVATVILFGIETYFTAYNMLLIDNNHVVLSEDTVLMIEGGIKKAILSVGLDPTDYAIHMMLMGYVPRILQVAAFFAIAAAIAKSGNEMIWHQAETTAEQTRISTELTVAKKIQADALPDLDEINGRFDFRIAADMRAARETGGDFYDFTMIDENHLAILIADVSDKGVPAAMFMMSAKSILNSFFDANKNPSQIIAETNNKLFANNKEGMFVTIWIGIYELDSGRLTSTNAGHEDPIVFSPGRGYFEVKEHHDVLVGEFENIEYTDNVMELKKGDILFLYTDGVSEATNSENEMYGVDRILSELNSECTDENMTAAEIIRNVKGDIDAFVGDAEQHDDITMLVLKV